MTYRFRIKGGRSVRQLNRLAPIVNFVWNYCNETSFKAIRDRSKWLSGFDLNYLTAGSSKELGLRSKTIEAICEQYANSRIRSKKRKLKWRVSYGPKRSLGWVPFKGDTVKITENKITYAKKVFKFWKSKELPGKPRFGSFSQDVLGHWYVNFVCEVNPVSTQHTIEEVGVDLGLKDIAVLSDGSRVQNQRIFSHHEAKVACLRRHRKKRQARKLEIKIKNIRKDFIHKKTLELARRYKTLYVGDVSGNFLQKTKGKSSQDASSGMFRQILKYKAIRHQGMVVDVSEFASTIICSVCFEKSGPSGLGGLRVREWVCRHCASHHDRDINAALNILRFGRESLRATKVA